MTYNNPFFLSRAPLATDVLAFATIIALIILPLAIVAIRSFNSYVWHKNLMTVTSVIVGLALISFEYQVRTYGWQETAQVSPYYETWLLPFLGFHIVIATLTLFLWCTTFLQAWQQFAKTPKPGSHSALHKRTGRLTLMGIYATIVSAWIVYYGAFIA